MFKEKITIIRALILGIFAIGLIGGIVVIKIGSNDKEKIKKQNYGVVNIWGTIGGDKFKTLKSKLLRNKDPLASSIVYTEIDKYNFEKILLNSIVSGRQPQMIITTNKNIDSLKRLLMPIDNRYLSAEKIRDNYLDASSVFVINNQVMALPIALDPLMMYYNKDIYTTNSILDISKTWDEFKENVSKISKRSGRDITLSGTALGSYNNVVYAKEILLALIMQTRKDFSGGILLKESDNTILESSLLLYTLFSNSSLQNRYYSWNSTQEDSISSFLSSKTATIFAPYSDNEKFRIRNPNLNYRIAEIPYSDSSRSIYKATYADVYGISFVKNAWNIRGAYYVFGDVMKDGFMKKLSESLELPSLKKSVLKNSRFDTIVKNSAIYSKTALITNESKINSTFEDLVNNVVTGRMSVGSAIKFAIDELNLLRR